MMGRSDKTVNNLHNKANYLYATSSSLKVLLHSVFQALQCTYQAAELDIIPRFYSSKRVRACSILDYVIAVTVISIIRMSTP